MFSPWAVFLGVHEGYVIMKDYSEDNNELYGSIMVENL
jgi:hypothetical protein